MSYGKPFTEKTDQLLASLHLHTTSIQRGPDQPLPERYRAVYATLWARWSMVVYRVSCTAVKGCLNLGDVLESLERAGYLVTKLTASADGNHQVHYSGDRFEGLLGGPIDQTWEIELTHFVESQ